MQPNSIDPSQPFNTKEMWQIARHFFAFQDYIDPDGHLWSRKEMLAMEKPNIQYITSQTNLSEKQMVFWGLAYTSAEIILFLAIMSIFWSPSMEDLNDIRIVGLLGLALLAWQLLFYRPVAFLMVFALCKLGIITRRRLR